MIRPLLTEIGIFLIPFVAYALFVLASRREVLSRSSWPVRTVLGLGMGACMLVILSLVLLANFSGAPPGATYTPARIENGKFIPGSDK
ncbi:hypothetical protein BN961_02369 [Afipia felis]|uniref:Uncharacterized protein n=1 Tax=Afipia felis TaxID=1035 RepID=A0A090MTN3_AFIFE|nr:MULTISPECIES: DUF6111 family protein [Afipia]EFI50653.1 conserved hypothetical protein [Afipia sp. 1NLS2]CEG08949.1 hypothetical protein BN961_02369 [Afipia felis]